MKVLYQAQVTAEGGCTGHIRSADDTLDLLLSSPHELGGIGGAATNPEQLFAVGHAVYFENAVLHVARGKQIKLAPTSVAATAGIDSREDDGFALMVSLSATPGGVDQAAVEAFVVTACGVCPYSYATCGNIDVQLNTVTR